MTICSIHIVQQEFAKAASSMAPQTGNRASIQSIQTVEYGYNVNPPPDKAHSSRDLFQDETQEETSCLERWRQDRVKTALLGCLSSSMVLTIRLLLDHDAPLAYILHAIIVFLDMILIHIFTHSVWLSVAGEIVTIVSFWAYHVTHEAVYELLETTLIAALCSFHMISQRKEVLQAKQVLENEVIDLEQQNLLLMRRQAIRDCRDLDLSHGQCQELKALALQYDEEEDDDDDEDHESRLHRLQKWLSPPQPMREKVAKVGHNLFEYFLDGSAGVMYTSFLGLIISELITSYGEDQPYR